MRNGLGARRVTVTPAVGIALLIGAIVLVPRLVPRSTDDSGSLADAGAPAPVPPSEAADARDARSEPIAEVHAEKATDRT